MLSLYSFGKLTVAPLLKAAWRIQVTGLDHIPADGPVILASNHLSVVDSIVIPVATPRPVYFLAKDEYFRNPVTRTLLTELNQVPVDRSGGRASLMALDAALPILRAGKVLGIHPEGTRSPDGRLYRGRPGAAKLAVDTGAALIPVGLLGTETIQSFGNRLPGFGSGVQVIVGKPLNLSRWDPQSADSRAYREITLELMGEIAALTGQQYVGRYAPKRGATAPNPAERPESGQPG